MNRGDSTQPGCRRLSKQSERPSTHHSRALLDVFLGSDRRRRKRWRKNTWIAMERVFLSPSPALSHIGITDVICSVGMKKLHVSLRQANGDLLTGVLTRQAGLETLRSVAIAIIISLNADQGTRDSAARPMATPALLGRAKPVRQRNFQLDF